MPETPTGYAEVRAAQREWLRRQILDKASALLETEGPGALTMRRLAGEVGASTSVLYTMFGGKSGIAEALWREGFAQLYRALERADGPGPLNRLAAMGRTYRDNALANRSYYAVMFQRPIPGFEPSDDAYQEALRTLEILADCVSDCIAARVFRPVDPDHVARVLWAAAHGAVSLELAGYEGVREAEARFTDLLGAAASWFMAR